MHVAMVTIWVADDFRTVIKLVLTYLCIKQFCCTIFSQSEKSIHTDHGIMASRTLSSLIARALAIIFALEFKSDISVTATFGW